jgi:hypothetical protein
MKRLSKKPNYMTVPAAIKRAREDRNDTSAWSSLSIGSRSNINSKENT